MNEVKDMIVREYERHHHGTDLDVDEMVLMENARILYDPDLGVNLTKTLSELSIGDSQFLRMDIPGTVPFVLVIREGEFSLGIEFLERERVDARLSILNAPKLCEKRKHDSDDEVIEEESDIEIVEAGSKRIKMD